MSLPVLARVVCPVFRDLNEATGQSFWTTSDQSDWDGGIYGDLIQATQDLSEATVVGVSIAQWYPGVGTPGVGPYATIADKVVFSVKSLAGVYGFLSIPAPIADIFDSTTQNVDLSHPLVEAWRLQVESLLGDTQGNLWSTLLSGRRRRVQVPTAFGPMP